MMGCDLACSETVCVSYSKRHWALLEATWTGQGICKGGEVEGLEI